MGDIKDTARSLKINAVITRACFEAVLYGHAKSTKMAVIKHADTELDHFIASNQLNEPIMTSLLERKTF